MTLLFINATRKWGGVKTWTLAFGQQLQVRGHRVVAAVREGTPFEAACRRSGFVTWPLRFRFKFDPVTLAALVRVFRSEKPDVAVVNISKDLELGALAGRLCRVPVVHRVGLVEDYRDRLGERLWHLRMVDRVVVPAYWMARELPRRFPWIDADRLRVVPNGRAGASMPEARGAGGEGFVVGTTSQLSPSKGHDVLFQGVSLARERGVDVRLRVAGTGDLAGDLARRAEQLGIADRVEFLGFQEHVPAFLAGLDAFALPSVKEGFPNALLEALWVGLPTISSDLPGTREMAEGCGVLVPAFGVLAWTEALSHLAGDTKERVRL
ncbi:MAG TPA: glycosyltransferase, partial [Deferrisomatales bacterium]|nr:glycosyltransferase [Deferrisomatales bacterium]